MRRRRSGTPIVVWLSLGAVAIALEVPVAIFVKNLATLRAAELSDGAPERSKGPVHVRLTPVTPKARAIRTPPVVKPPPEPVKVLGQVVEIKPPVTEEAPKKARYLAQFDSTVPKEVKGLARKKSREERLGTTPEDSASTLQSPDSTSPKPTSAPDATPQQPLKPGVQGGSRPTEVAPGRGTLIARDRGTPVLVPTLDKRSAIANVQALTGAGASNDALMDIKDEGSDTLLNSRKFQHWDFFNRVKERVSQHWQPNTAYHEADPTGKVYGVKDRLTVIQVTLDRQGGLLRMLTVKDSGIGELDREAKKALKEASPFRNPPTALFGEDGKLVFQFGFLFEISTSRFKFFRVPN